MPDAIITSTASTFGTISGTFAADQSTVTGTVTGIVAGTLSGSVGVPGPAGAGVPAGGTAGQYLQKIDGVDYNTDWVTLNLSGYAPLASPAFTGNPTAPTAALGDNDTSLATTAFVQQELLSGTANAKNLEVYVRNQTGSTLAAGAIVYVNGATGNRPTVTLAQANNDANSAQTMGFVKTAIANNGFGYVIVRGECENLDTSAVAEGTQLYLSPTVAGAYTTTKPSAPQHLVYVGIVIRSHPTQGVILVAVQNGYELNELHDVAISSPTNGQVLKYNSTTGLWYNGTDSAGVAWGGITGTLSSQTDLQTALDGKYSTTNPAGYITSSALTGYATETFVTSQGYITSAALSPYLTSATAASTYQTLSGMSSYLTTSAAASTYLTQANAASTYYLQTNPAGYITSSALSPYLTSATAASTYAPIASPTFTGLATFDNPGNYAISVPASGVGYDIRIEGQLFTMRNASAEVIRISPGGIKYPDGVTQSVAYPGPSGFLLKADNLSGLANTGTARTNLGLGTMATETASNYLTTATAASTYFTIASAANKADLASPALTGTPTAPTAAVDTNTTQLATTAYVVGQGYAKLASPTFTGTPTLPTGTIAVTQSAGNNTTAVATTAFVQTSNPDASTTTKGHVELATDAEAVNGTSTTLAVTPKGVRAELTSSNHINIIHSSLTNTNVGTVTSVISGFFTTRARLGTAGACSARQRIFGASQCDQLLYSEYSSLTNYNFDNPRIMSGRYGVNIITDANFRAGVCHGKIEADAVGDLTRRGMAWYFTGGSGSRFLILQVHNGTTLTNVTSSHAITATTTFDWAIESDGLGNVSLIVNGTQVATTSAGPVGVSTASTPAPYQQETIASAALASAYNDSYFSRGNLYIKGF